MASTIQAARILVIEDEQDIIDLIQTGLEASGYTVEVASDGLQGLYAVRARTPDLILLDRMLPGMEGIDVCRRIRQSSDVPIVMLTALGTIGDRVDGLDAGANDYLVKPFAFEELLARVRAQLRAKHPEEKPALHWQDLAFDVAGRLAWRGERPLELARKEFDLLLYFARHPDVVLGRERLLTAIWGDDFPGDDNVLEVYVGYLRRKLEADGESRLLQTVRGVGYVLRANAAKPQ